MSVTTKPLGSLRRGLIATLIPVMGVALPLGAEAAASKLTVTAKYDKTGNLLVSGKFAGAPVGTLVEVFDAEGHLPLYSAKTLSNSSFSLSVKPDNKSVCGVLVESLDVKATIAVTGGDSICAKKPVCAISGNNQFIKEGGTASFKVLANKAVPTSYKWFINDAGTLVKNSGSLADSGTGSTLNHAFAHAGLYQVQVVASNASGSCSDDVLVSVAPLVSNTSSVKEAPKPLTAEALKDDKNAFVVLPFEDTGMQGGSKMHLPYNPLLPYNQFNAQVIQKKEHKPPLISSSDVSVYYSAASNPNDPLGPGSINSTSSNLFLDMQTGGNIDLTKTTVNPTTFVPINNVFPEKHGYLDGLIRKSEQWDRMYQKNASKRNQGQTSYDFAWQQNRFVPARRIQNPDEGIRGYLNNGDYFSMPGIADPYKANDPQKFGYSAGQSSFIAQFIPVSSTDDKGQTNPYPLMRVEAKVNGQTVAKTDGVLTAASETRCRECHLPGGIGSDDTVWRTPVTENEIKLADGSPGPATGAGNFDPGTPGLEGKAWPPAIHNRFNDKHPENPSFTNLLAGTTQKDANGLRTDRVKESRWVKLDGKGNPTGEISATQPADATGWTLQLKVKFKSASDYGKADDPLAQEKAAVFNTMVLHDYMVFYGPTPAAGKTWPASYSSQIADAYSDDDVAKASANPQYFCSGHHQSHLKFDVGIAGKAPPTNRSDYSHAFHAFHGKLQVYTTGAQAGQLIRDSRGHPQMFGGRGWDSQKNDDNGVPLVAQSDGSFADPAVIRGKDPITWDKTKYSVPTWDPAKNNWRPDLYPMHSQGKLLYEFGPKVASEDNCARCHTGKTEKGYRDIHHAAGLKCDNCHGDMLAVGNVYPNEGYDANLMWAGKFGKDTANAYGSNPVTNLLISEPADFRRTWIDEPNCGSCHIGDGNLKEGDPVHGGHHSLANVFSAGALKQAYMNGDASGKSVEPLNARFAVMPVLETRKEKVTINDANFNPVKTDYTDAPLSTVLYRKSGDVHGSGANGALNCSTCHGGSHAIWPNPDPNANDNVTAKQLQGYDGNIAECSVCHIKDDFKTGLVATDGGASGLGVGQGVRDGTVITPNAANSKQKAFLAGPHGMHPVNDESWWKDAKGVTVDDFVSKTGNGGWHSEMAYKPGPDGEDQCAACHGANHKGTRLSKSLTARTFVSDKGKTIKVEAGQVIGCDLCHAMNVSFKRSPDPKKADGGWPKAKEHAAPAPQALKGSTSSGSSGGGMSMGGMGH